MRRHIAGYVLSILALLGAGPAQALQVPALTDSGEVAVVDLKSDGIGSGKAAAQTGSAGVEVELDRTTLMPDGLFMFDGDGVARLFGLFGGALMEMENFEQRLIAKLTGQTPPDLVVVVLVDRDERPQAREKQLSPVSGLKSRRAEKKPRKQRPRRRQPRPDRGAGSAPDGKRTFTVLATAEGLIGGRTASGLIIKQYTEGGALPDRSALGKRTHVIYKKNKRDADAPIHDVGPWNTRDPYWRKPNGRPQAESGRDLTGRRTNKAGIDLMNGTWYKLLGLRTYDKRLIESTSGTVTWWFE